MELLSFGGIHVFSDVSHIDDHRVTDHPLILAALERGIARLWAPRSATCPSKNSSRPGSPRCICCRSRTSRFTPVRSRTRCSSTRSPAVNQWSPSASSTACCRPSAPSTAVRARAPRPAPCHPARRLRTPRPLLDIASRGEIPMNGAAYAQQLPEPIGLNPWARKPVLLLICARKALSERRRDHSTGFLYEVFARLLPGRGTQRCRRQPQPAVAGFIRAEPQDWLTT